MRHLKQSGAPAWRPSAVSVFLLRNLENSMQSYPNRFFGRDLGGGNFWVPNYLDFLVSNTQASADVTFKRRNPLCDSLPSVLCPPCALPRRLLWRLAAGSAIIHFPFLGPSVPPSVPPPPITRALILKNCPFYSKGKVQSTRSSFLQRPCPPRPRSTFLPGRERRRGGSALLTSSEDKPACLTLRRRKRLLVK